MASVYAVLSMVDHHVRAMVPDRGQAGVGPAGADHGHSMRARELHRGETDTAGRSVHEDRFRRARSAALKQCAIGGRVGNAERGALLECDTRRERVQLIGRRQHELCVGADAGGLPSRPADVHAIPGREPIDSVADGFHFARTVESRREQRDRFSRVRAGADVAVDRIDARRANPDEHFTLVRPRIGDFFPLQ